MIGRADIICRRPMSADTQLVRYFDGMYRDRSWNREGGVEEAKAAEAEIASVVKEVDRTKRARPGFIVSDAR